MRKFTKLFMSLVVMMFIFISSSAQTVKIYWELSDINDSSKVEITGPEDDILLIESVNFALGPNFTITRFLTESGADDGYEAVIYDPPFMAIQPSSVASSATSGHTLTFTVTPLEGHKFKPTRVSFDACRIGTDKGGITVRAKDGSNSEDEIGSATPLRNKIQDGDPTGYSNHEFFINDYNTEETWSLILYPYNIDTNKEMGFRCITIEGEMDSRIYSVADFVSSFTFTGEINGDTQTIDMTSQVSGLANGSTLGYYTKLSAEPTDFNVTLTEEFADCEASVTYANHLAKVVITRDGDEVMQFTVFFQVAYPIVHGELKPLTRGTMAIHQSTGNLVSWRARKADDKNLKFRLLRGTSAASQEEEVNGGNPISGKTNYLDPDGTADSYYKLEVLDASGAVIETDVSDKTWENQTLYIPITDGPPTDPSGLGASYTPNDAAFCDMDGDGQYDIILKWSPSNEKDAASSGSTSNVFYDCYKMDGTHLWRIDMGQNFFASAHTMQFIAWDFDGDGYGEFMVKTAPGTIDGQGNYVIMEGDDPTANLKGGNGKQTSGPEYITVFDGTTGAELATIPYHTDYAAGEAYWGDSNQNRSERYLAAIGWLDGEDANPSPIFARGYYSGAFVGAYDWDGTTLKERWVSRNTTSGQGLWGEGAHWISVGDCDGDGKQDIVYGAAALKSDGTLLHRTGLKHGDALHLGDFDPDHEGLEIFMVHEDSPYGCSLRDANTGEFLIHQTASSDTGRGIMAHNNPEVEGSYFQTSASYDSSTYTYEMYDWNETLVSNSITHGGYGSLNNRIFWDGTLGEEHYDKNVLENFNPTTMLFERIYVNGGTYVVGTENNDSKRNPCVMGDILGDWREEIILWDYDDDNDMYYFVINATNYETDYTVPHLMDDLNYRAQVINQNCCYNQPPHLSYDLRNSKKITRDLFQADIEVESNPEIGKYWDCIYTTYPLIIPEDIAAWMVTGYDNATDTVKIEKLEPGSRIAANTGIIYNAINKNVTFTPTSLEANTLDASLINGGYCDEVLGDSDSEKGYYQFMMSDAGLGFYRVSGTTIEGGTGYAIFESEDGDPLQEYYILGESAYAEATGIMENLIDEQILREDGAIYNLQGIRLNSIPQKGVYIIGGKKYVK